MWAKNWWQLEGEAISQSNHKAVERSDPYSPNTVNYKKFKALKFQMAALRQSLMRMQKETGIWTKIVMRMLSSKCLQRGKWCFCARTMKDSAPVCTLHSSGNSWSIGLSFPHSQKDAERSGLASNHPQPQFLAPSGFVELPSSPVGARSNQARRRNNYRANYNRVNQAWFHGETLTPTLNHAYETRGWAGCNFSSGTLQNLLEEAPRAPSHPRQHRWALVALWCFSARCPP